MNELKKEFGKRLAEIRKSKKIKQEELKELINAPTVQMISGWECGHSFPSANYLIILAKKLDISLDYLLLGKNNNAKNKKIFTYKDAAECMIELQSCGLFSISGYQYSSDLYQTNLYTFDKKIESFKLEFDNLMTAAKTLRKELFDQAVIDLLNKYDIPLTKK